MPIYASPEIWREELYQAKADIWSLGCILYELCTLKHPFRAEDMDSTFRKISKGFFQRIPAHFSAELGQLLKATLQTSATSRASCEEILQFLKNARFCRKLQENNRGFLLKTMKFPKKPQDLKGILPPPDYSSRKFEEIPRISQKNEPFLKEKASGFPKIAKLQRFLRESPEKSAEIAPLFEERVFFIEKLGLQRRTRRKNWKSCADEREFFKKLPKIL